MSAPNVVFCVEWGVSPITYAGECFPRLKTFSSAYDARDFFDGIDLRTIFELCIEDQPAHATDIIAKKFCYVGERGACNRIAPTVFLDRADYDYGAHEIDSLEKPGSRW